MQLFLDAEDGVIEFIDTEGREFSREINETLTDVLNPAKPLQNFAYMGFAENSGRFDNHDSFAVLSGVQTSGSGASLIVTEFTYDPEVPNTYTANAGAAPVPPIHDMINRPWILYPELPPHGPHHNR